MYLSYYNLSEWPFQINSDPRFLWLGEKHKEALATLIYGVQDQKGFLVLTGDVGTGKTTLVNALLRQLDGSILVGNITDPMLDLIGFLNAVSVSLGNYEKVEKKEDFLLRFSRFLNEKYAENKYVLLIIDEAHKLNTDLLEQIRLLSNIELPERKLISIFLVGQDELSETLTSHQCRALRQRITLISRVEPLSEEETGEYIRHRLKVAGTNRELFSKAAVREIYRLSRGYPRVINILCDHALLSGYVKESRKITPGIVRGCGQEMLLPGEHDESLRRPLENLEQGEEPEPKRLREFASSEREDSPRPRSLRSGLRAKSLRYWAMWACPVVLILSLTVISRTDLFSKRERREPAVSENAPPVAQSPPSDSTTTVLSAETTAGGSEGTEIGAVSASPSDVQKDLPEPQALASLSDGEKGNDPAGEATPGAVNEGALDSVEDAVRREDFKGAIELSEKFMADNASTPPGLKELYLDALVSQAEILAGTDVIASQELLDRAVSADPENLKALLLLGKVHTAGKQYGKALQAYQKAADLSPEMPGLFFNLGFLYAAKNDYGPAEEAFARAIELSPPFLDQALFNLAVVQDKLGKRGASLDSLRKALEANPNNQKARELLKRVAGDSGDRS
jgi:type II secretory pathway predicted ATPase ExeA/Flp pilus assembly protein TadD